MKLSLVKSPVRLGVLTDIQYADKPDRSIGPNDDPQVAERFRRYSCALDKTRHAAEHLNAENVTATLHLGDIVDGNQTVDQTRTELHAVLSALSTLQSPVLHVLGNHCLDAGRQYLTDALKLPRAYYVHDLSPLWRLIVLDTVDVSVSRDDDHPYRLLAERYLKEHAEDVNANVWNGAVGPEQLHWFKAQIDEAERDGMFLIVCGHIPLLGTASAEKHTLWNAQELLDVFKQRSAVIKAYFAGHFHEGGYAECNGVHHLTFESVLDSQPDDGSWGVVELYTDRILVHGKGEMTSRELELL